MNVKKRLKKIEQKAQTNETKYLKFIIGYGDNKEGLLFEKDGNVLNDITILDGTKHVEGSSEEGKRILLEAGYKIINKDSVGKE